MTVNRKIYLVRHGEIVHDKDEKVCLGCRSDPPLSERGIRQAEALGEWFRERGVSEVYSSPLRRCDSTARIIAEKASAAGPYTEDDLREVDTGEWDGLTFSEIRERYPSDYASRGRDIFGYPPPGGESFAGALERFSRCVSVLTSVIKGDAVIVAHAGVIRAFICALSGRDPGELFSIPQPYAGITTLVYGVPQEGGLSLRILSPGYRPDSLLDREETERLYRMFETPSGVIDHMEAVAEYAGKLADELGGNFDRERLVKAALVHDIARTKKRHAEAGADALEREGFYDIARLVRVHQSPEATDEEKLSEEDILFYADKRFSGTRFVTVRQRFDESLEKCRTEEALKNHQMMLEKTLLIEKKISGYLDK